MGAFLLPKIRVWEEFWEELMGFLSEIRGDLVTGITVHSLLRFKRRSEFSENPRD
jgi:hypothetical protein